MCGQDPRFQALAHPLPQLFSVPRFQRDTIATDEKDDEINTHEHPGVGRSPVGHDPVVHHGVPVFTGQDLGGEGAQ